jgi:hypothetical protein
VCQEHHQPERLPLISRKPPLPRMLLLNPDPFAYCSPGNIDTPAKCIQVPTRAKLITSPRKKRLTWRFLNPLSAVPISSRCCRECRVSNTFQDHGKFWIGNMLVCVIPGRECMIVVVHAAIVGGADNRAKREHRGESSHGLTADCWRISALRCSSDSRRSSRSSSAGNRLGLHWGLKPPITTNVYPQQSASLVHSVRQCVCACALSQMVSPNQRSVEPVNRVPCWGGASGS